MTSSSGLVIKGKIIDFHANYLWPFHRLFVSKHISKRCIGCMVSEKYTQLNGAGRCVKCENPKQEIDIALSRGHKEQEIDGILNTFQNKGERLYDALVMFSGGKDSAYLLHLLQVKFPSLRLLAVTIDNGYMSPVALDNAVHIVEKLDVDHIILKPKPSLFNTAFKYACTHLQPKKGCLEIVDKMDAELGFSLCKIYAASNHIPIIINGLSYAQVENIFGVTSYEVPREQIEKKVTSIIGKSLDAIFSSEELAYWWNPDKYGKEYLPRIFNPFCVWDYDEEFIKGEVVKLGLISKSNQSPLVTNSSIIPMMVVIDFLHLGYASFEPEFAELIREGKASRKYWKNVFEIIEYSSKTGWMLDKEIDKILSRLELTRQSIGLER